MSDKKPSDSSSDSAEQTVETVHERDSALEVEKLRLDIDTLRRQLGTGRILP